MNQELHNKTVIHFDNLISESQSFPKRISFERDECKFRRKVWSLFSHIVEEKDLVRGEEPIEPINPEWDTHEMKEQYEAWQNFEPLFTNKITKESIGWIVGETVYEMVDELGWKLNPLHPLVKDIEYWNEVNKVEL